MNKLPTPADAARRLTELAYRVSPADLHLLIGIEHPGLYAWFVDVDGARELATGVGLPVTEGLIYAGQAGAGTSQATLESRINRNHLGIDIHRSTFRLTLASALRTQLALEPMGTIHISRDGEGRLTNWMYEHLVVSVLAYSDRPTLGRFETDVLGRLDPPLNISKRPASPVRRQLKLLRQQFGRRVAGVARRKRLQQRTLVTDSAETGGLTPEALARSLGMPSAKRVRGLLRERFPRPHSELWSRWRPLTPEMERAVRDRFGSGRLRE
jgi:hypothetical protein